MQLVVLGLKKNILVLYYSQSGQLERVLRSFCAPLLSNKNINCDILSIKPVKEYPYPWGFYKFFNVFPEAVYMDGCEVEPLKLKKKYDLIILGYTSWFLSPSIPVTGFLQSAQARNLFKNKPVVTVIACRDMWIMAQEKMKVLLGDLGARLKDNVVLTDQGKSLFTFFTTPRWMFTGKKDAFLFFPKAGVSETDIAACSRFGKKLAGALAKNEEKSDLPMLKNMGAVRVQGKLIATEQIAHRSFLIWCKLIKKAGDQDSLGRNIVITIYTGFLIFLILSVVPLNILIRKLIFPFRKKAINESIKFYEKPSGK